MEVSLLPFDILYKSLEPLMSDLLDKHNILIKFEIVPAHVAINHTLNIVCNHLKKSQLGGGFMDLETYFTILSNYFNHIRQIYYNGLNMDWWYSDEIEIFEAASTSIYLNFIENFSELQN